MKDLIEKIKKAKAGTITSEELEEFCVLVNEIIYDVVDYITAAVDNISNYVVEVLEKAKSGTISSKEKEILVPILSIWYELQAEKRKLDAYLFIIGEHARRK